MSVKLFIKRILSSAFTISGIQLISEHQIFSDKAFVLMYHRVLASPDKQPLFVQPGMYVSTPSFEKQIAFLKDRFKVLFLDDLVEKIVTGGEIGGCCAITFDDGWRDNYSDAFPVMKKFSLPSTIFLATGFVGSENIFWPDEICLYLDRESANLDNFVGAPPSLVRFCKEISRTRKDTAEWMLENAIGILKEYSPEDRGEILGFLRDNYSGAPVPRQMLNWDEVGEMDASGLVRFGAHTVNHEMLDQVPLKNVIEEITQSREEIERRLGNRVTTFAYPNGNNNECIRRVLAEKGFSAAVTTRKGYLDGKTPLMAIPRIAMHDDVSNTVPMFRSRILFRRF
jgi:peptidoglycan/xylan/chitin deacetylase (PgdA/CDA1 family)